VAVRVAASALPNAVNRPCVKDKFQTTVISYNPDWTGE
jgi:hypothetical protein